MNDSLMQVIYTYTTRRWLMWGMFGGAMLLALVVAAASYTSGIPHPMLVGQLLGLPLMLGILWLAIHAKWQFVHSRARLYPNYAAPHLAVIIGIAVVMLVVYPLALSQLLRAPTLGVLAFALLFGAAVVWQIQSMRVTLSLVSLALWFGFYVPGIASVWLNPDARYVPFRIAAIVIGAAGFGAWLYRLPRMMEEDDDYLLPIQTNAANASRIEKSESRRLLARMISRSWFTSWVTDRWHDRLAKMSPARERDRGRLLRYGTVSIPAPMIGLNLMVMAVLIVAMQYAILTSDRDAGFSTRVPAMILGQLGGFSLFVLPIICQFLSQRRGRFAQDLMLPMTREAYVDGLFRSVVVSGLWGMLPVLLVLVGATTIIAPQYFTWTYVAAGLVTIAALVPIAAGISFRMVLVGSGMKRMLVLIVLLYPLIGVAIGLFAITAYVNVALGFVLGALLVGIGYAACRWARRVWLDAELGCL
ncbi:hypothetical protein [Aeoliella sp. SH292]|uniref:hypothetical protein n=1 Tax=Aeoliella sp. SH292 TaxID=3454464 RepID=UPI003F99217C